MIIRTSDGIEHLVGGPDGQGAMFTQRGLGTEENFFDWEDIEDVFSGGRWWYSLDNEFPVSVSSTSTAKKENL